MKKDVETHKLKVYTIKRLLAFKKLIKENNNKKDWLTVSEVIDEFSISRKTFDRLREKGLKVYQPVLNGKILISRDEFINFLKN